MRGEAMLINTIAAAVPQKEFAVSSFVKSGIMSTEQYARALSMHCDTIRYDPKMSGLDLILASMDKLMEAGSVKPQNVSYVVLCYDHILMSNLLNIKSLLQTRYQLRKTEVLTIRDLYCSTALMGLKVCKELLAASSEEDQIIMVVVERGPALEDRFDGYFVTGDSSVSVLLQLSGAGDSVLKVRHETTDNTDIPYGNFFTPIHLAKLFSNTVKAAGLTISTIKKVITNNVYSEVWNAVAKTSKLPKALFYVEDTRPFGPLEMSDVLLHCEAARQVGLVKGDYFALLTLGLYGGMGCAICRRN
ncbi:hypothetical protein [Paenibacillus tarimensis]|uniref:hypothetical protein n=1 Tax=Paenibacillus tarimensis TaxID=416012 RepID=UPI0039F09867